MYKVNACSSSILSKLILSAFLILSAGVSAWSQEMLEVCGVITDAATGETIPAATVLMKGTTTGSVADFDGNYTIRVTPDAILIFTIRQSEGGQTYGRERLLE